MSSMVKRVLVVGGGFGGVAGALELAKRRDPRLDVMLITNKPHFEYTPMLYRVVTGRSPLEVCVPLTEIFRDRPVEVVVDELISFDPSLRTAQGMSGRRYDYDYAVLALGSETAYFNLPGLAEFSFGFKSIKEALRLEQHIHQLFSQCLDEKLETELKVCLLHLVIVGAGPSGVELAGELAGYLKQLSRHYKVAHDLVTIDLFEGAPRVLPSLPPAVSGLAAQRLRRLGVNIFLNRALVKEEAEQIVVKGLSTKTKTVIWTAGVKPNSFYQKISGLTLDQRGRVVVDEHLRAQKFSDLFIIGDGAATTFTGMAQTAGHNGRAAAANVILSAAKQPLKIYHPKKPYYAVPIGRGWAVTKLGPFVIAGRLGWFVRRLADFRYFLSILTVGQAITAFRIGKRLGHHCPLCAKSDKIS